jgi:hypothetical protein
MNVVRRAATILLDPVAEWARIEKEADDVIYLMTRYVAALALIPAVFGFIGVSVVGVLVPGVGTVRASLFDGIFGAMFGYLESFVVVALLGSMIAVLAPMFGGKRDFAGAIKLAGYSCTPLWLAGIFLLLPGLHFLLLTGLYGGYLVMTGLPLLAKCPVRTAPVFALVTVGCAVALTVGAAAAQRMLFAGSVGL